MERNLSFLFLFPTPLNSFLQVFSCNTLHQTNSFGRFFPATVYVFFAGFFLQQYMAFLQFFFPATVYGFSCSVFFLQQYMVHMLSCILSFHQLFRCRSPEYRTGIQAVIFFSGFCNFSMIVFYGRQTIVLIPMSNHAVWPCGISYIISMLVFIYPYFVSHEPIYLSKGCHSEYSGRYSSPLEITGSG